MSFFIADNRNVFPSKRFGAIAVVETDDMVMDALTASFVHRIAKLTVVDSTYWTLADEIVKLLSLKKQLDVKLFACDYYYLFVINFIAYSHLNIENDTVYNAVNRVADQFIATYNWENLHFSDNVIDLLVSLLKNESDIPADYVQYIDSESFKKDFLGAMSSLGTEWKIRLMYLIEAGYFTETIVKGARMECSQNAMDSIIFRDKSVTKEALSILSDDRTILLSFLASIPVNALELLFSKDSAQVAVEQKSIFDALLDNLNENVWMITYDAYIRWVECTSGKFLNDLVESD